MFEALLKKLALGLGNAKLPYMIIGGQAVLIYGEPRLTRDIDVTLGLAPADAATLMSLIPELNLTVLVEEPEQFLRKTFVLPTIESSSGIRVDFIFSLSEYETGALRRARTVEIQGIPIKFINLEDLVIHKIIAGRPRDIEDVTAILLKNKSCDLKFVKKWLIEFDSQLGEHFESRLDSLLQDLKF